MTEVQGDRHGQRILPVMRWIDGDRVLRGSEYAEKTLRIEIIDKVDFSSWAPSFVPNAPSSKSSFL